MKNNYLRYALCIMAALLNAALLQAQSTRHLSQQIICANNDTCYRILNQYTPPIFVNEVENVLAVPATTKWEKPKVVWNWKVDGCLGGPPDWILQDVPAQYKKVVRSVLKQPAYWREEWIPVSCKAAIANIHLFPNPVSDILHIDCAEKISEISLYTSNGALVAQQNFGIGLTNASMLVNHLPASSYIALIKLSSGAMQQQAVIVSR
jgi:hypothetical protein